MVSEEDEVYIFEEFWKFEDRSHVEMNINFS